MQLENPDPSLWADIVRRIDGNFGEGVTAGLVGENLPVVLRTDGRLSVYLIPPSWPSLLGSVDGPFTVTSLGVHLCDWDGTTLRLGLPMIEHLSRLTECKITVSSRGAQAFTYGRSLIKESIVSLKGASRRGQLVVVLDEKNVCLGLAALSVDPSRFDRLGRNDLVARNVMDIGWYIRRSS
ncbi:MAG: hypothetical protein QXS20_05080 [Candidatus Thorarchaeota archaeon]